MKELFHFIISPFLLTEFLFGQIIDRDGVCGTPPMASEEVLQIKSAVESWLPLRP